MFYNVINNAIKNTSKGGRIIVRGLSDHGEYKVNIADTGRGMDEAQMITLFSRFKSRKDSDENGTGIGLAITKSIADFHSIEVSVTSEPEKGTTFSFIFPENSL
jgi:signal transduction histidine kinase